MIKIAERRMFSKRIISSARFLKMPVSTQCLYFHLGLNADDDGIVEAYMTMNMVGSTEDDLRILVAKDFVQVLNEDLVTYITDWKENNKLRADRKVDSIYKDLLLQVSPKTELLESKERADRKKNDDGTSHGQPMDNQWTSNGPHRLGKDRLGKDSIGKYSNNTSDDENISFEEPKKNKKKYGAYKKVLLTDEEKEKLLDELKDEKFDLCIKKLDEYLEETGKKYKNHYLTIKRWVIAAVDEELKNININTNSISKSQNNIPTPRTRFHNINETFRNYEPDELNRLLKESQKGKFK